MCGITGFIPTNSVGDNFLNKAIDDMSQALVHRGPDSSGVWIDSNHKVALGFRRLAILDLSPAGSQPMISSSGRYVMVFNGEIYNHQELRARMPEKSWRGHADSESLLESFDHSGIATTLSSATGMFAIAVWDNKHNILTLARDRVGEKPLYYGMVNHHFVFGSELKAISAFPDFNNRISREAIAEYLKFNYIPAPKSIYEHIFKLKPGCFIEIKAGSIDQNFHADEIPFWSLDKIIIDSKKSQIPDMQTAKNLVEKTLTDSVIMQMQSDVPLGSFLSGGIDSSLITGIMQKQSIKKIQTFTIGFEEDEFNEAIYSKKIAEHLNTEHTEIILTAKDALNIISDLPHIYDEPFADSSQIPTHLVSLSARSSIKVALTGDGGDEVFGGYNRYFWTERLWNKISILPLQLRKLIGEILVRFPENGWRLVEKLINSLGKDANGISHMGNKAFKFGSLLRNSQNLDEIYFNLISSKIDIQDFVKDLPEGYSSMQIEDLTAVKLSGPHFQNASEQMMFWDTLTYLPDDILCKVDRASMATSLETRAPFLDHNIIELAWRLPLELKIKNNSGKLILRNILENYVPNSLMERPKIGFGLPLKDWLRGPLREWAEDLLDETRMTQEGFFYAAPIQSLWREHIYNQADYTEFLWSILMFQAWLREAKSS